MGQTREIVIWRMIALCVVVFSCVCLCLIIAFPDNFLELVFFFGYMALGCTFLPLPTPQIVMDYGQRFNPIFIATLGSIAFCLSATIDYSMVTFLFRSERIREIKNRKVYIYIEKFFNKYAFVTLVFAAFTPFPVDPVKLVACATRYSRFKYLLACFMGRFPRYWLLGVIQGPLDIPREYLYGSILVMIAIEIIRRAIKRLIRKR